MYEEIKCRLKTPPSGWIMKFSDKVWTSADNSCSSKGISNKRPQTPACLAAYLYQNIHLHHRRLEFNQNKMSSSHK